VRSYYAAEAAIRYYGPQVEGVRSEAGHVQAVIAKFFTGTPTWKLPPHEYLTGMELAPWNAERIVAFTLRYGPLAPRHDWSQKLEREIHTSADAERLEPGDPVWVDVAQFVALQKLLRDAWHGDKAALELLTDGLADDVDLNMRRSGIELAVRDLWTFIRIVFLEDYARGKTKVCPNPDCRGMPCFLEGRMGQKYCSHRCAVLISVHRHRERKAGRRVQKLKEKGRRR